MSEKESQYKAQLDLHTNLSVTMKSTGILLLVITFFGVCFLGSSEKAKNNRYMVKVILRDRFQPQKGYMFLNFKTGKILKSTTKIPLDEENYQKGNPAPGHVLQPKGIYNAGIYSDIPVDKIKEVEFEWESPDGNHKKSIKVNQITITPHFDSPKDGAQMKKTLCYDFNEGEVFSGEPVTLKDCYYTG